MMSEKIYIVENPQTRLYTISFSKPVVESFIVKTFEKSEKSLAEKFIKDNNIEIME